MPDTTLIMALQTFSHLIFKESYKEKYHYSHFIDRQTEALRLTFQDHMAKKCQFQAPNSDGFTGCPPNYCAQMC